MLVFFIRLVFFSILPIVACYATFNQISAGPEVFYLKRCREGGSSQSGTLCGVRASYDRLARCKWYYGLEGAYANGDINGKSRSGSRLRSYFRQSNIEGRVGYTFQSQGEEYISITPYISAGYYLELNNYKTPSALKVHFKNRFYYGGVGCILWGCLTEKIYFGLNVTGRWSSDGKVTTSHDPELDSVQIKYMQKVQCRVSLPFSFQFSASPCCIYLDFVPFFEYRHYGKKRAIPFDFLDTRIRCWGGNILITWIF
jgi:hypothetical protein